MPPRSSFPVLLAVLALVAACSGHGRAPIDPIELATGSLAPGRVAEPYAVVLEARGGVAPIRFSAGDGDLPPGLTLHGDGLLDGTPTDAGDFTLTVGLADARGDQALGTVGLTIDPAAPLPLRIVTEALPLADVSEPYLAALEADGGTAPYVWTIAGGELPAGLGLDDEAAAIAGTPTEAGVASVTVRVRDAAGELRERTLELRVASAPELLTELFPIGVVGEPYTAELQVAGGSWPLRFEAYSGTLPAGLVLHPSGLVAGTPTVVSSRPVRFRVTDAAGVTRDRRIRIWIVDDRPTESWSNTEVPANCELAAPLVVTGTLRVDDPAMIARVQVALDIDYADMGMLDATIVAPDGTRVPLHVGGGVIGGGPGLHFMFETDRISSGSFAPLRGLGPAGIWTLEVRVLPDPGFGCVEEPGRLQRFAVVIGAERSSADYLRVHGFSPNNLIDTAFARVTGGGLDQDELELLVELWSTGANEIPEGGTGDDVLVELVPLAWSSDLPAEVGAISADGHFQSGAQTGEGTLTGTAGDLEVAVPIKIVPPDWVP